jgi:hypothetical protein
LLLIVVAVHLFLQTWSSEEGLRNPTGIARPSEAVYVKPMYEVLSTLRWKASTETASIVARHN